MRSLQRNHRNLYYSTPQGKESIFDEYGNDTLEVKTLYGDPKPLRVNVSANVGQEAISVFGAMTGYNRTISYMGESCPLIEGSKVWFGVNTKESHNYIVVKVADSKNGYLIALREVSERG